MSSGARVHCRRRDNSAAGTCIPSYPANAPTFVDTAIASLAPKSGYSRSFQSGPAPSPINTMVSGTASASSYAYVASPVNPGQTGVRGFAGDASVIVCFTPDGNTPPTVANGAITVASCSILQ